jgi:stage II sporulation SpoAA-like protein
MLTPLRSPASHVVAARLDGKVTKDDVAQAMKLVETALQESERVNLLFDLTGVEGVEPAALIKDLAFGLKNFGRLYRFQQMAVITDNESLGKVVKWEDWLFKSIEIKRFASQDTAQAFNWSETKLEIPPPGFEHKPNDEYLELHYGERLTGYDVSRIADLLRTRYDQSGPVRVLAFTQGIPKIGEGVLYEKLRQFKVRGLLARVAVVGPDSLANRIKAFNAVIQTQLKHFAPAQVDDAKTWLTDDSPQVEVLPTDSEHIFALRISGKITSVEVESSYAELLPHMKGDNATDVMLEIPYQDGITVTALFHAIKLGIKHYGKVTKGIRRLAIITDSRFVSKATEVENILIQSIEERPFTFKQRDIALAWLSEGRAEIDSTETTHLPAGEATKMLPGGATKLLAADATKTSEASE